MVNCGYIYDLNPLTGDTLEPILREAVEREALDTRWIVQRFEASDPSFVVSLPGSVPDEEEALRLGVAPRQTLGFRVTLRDGGTTIAFQRPASPFLGWALGRLAETLADRFNTGVSYKSGETCPPGTFRYRQGQNFRAYLLSRFPSPTREEAAWVAQFRGCVPGGHW